MILADTSVWIDYLRKTDALLASLLNTVQIVIHPFIIGELACGNLKNRNALLFLACIFPKNKPRAGGSCPVSCTGWKLMRSSEAAAKVGTAS